MKKVMFAALVACTAGVAMAAVGYDFTATLKTTVGKNGKDVTETYNFGKDNVGNFWYKDGGWADVNNNYIRSASCLSNNVMTKVIQGGNVLGFIKDSKGYVTLNDTDDLVYIRQLANRYNVKSAGVWCDTIKVLIPAQCYRVAGTKKIKNKVWNGNGCCGEADGEFYGQSWIPYSLSVMTIERTYWDHSTTGNVLEATSSSNVYTNMSFAQFFGAQTIEKATKVEIFAPVQSYDTDGTPFFGFLAGQGTRTGDRINTISGNIVGKFTAPTCEKCCLDPSKAIAFDCWANDQVGKQELDTAAFGTFRIKYNKNY